MKKSFILILLILAIASISVTANGTNGVTGVAVSDYDSTIISGIYIPYQGNTSLIPVGENVQITCNNTTASTVISTNETVIDSMGYYSKIVPSSECTVGDQVQSCVGSECSAWETVEAIGNTGWASGIAHIIGVPEYTTAAMAFLMLFTGGGIAYLRNKKR
ncbi:MAG: hypothetical protein U9R34_04930 [Nanoarchaeota archaeon]|nr:hypothetical protein [Nanoarchaeota archaeon]